MTDQQLLPNTSDYIGNQHIARLRRKMYPGSPVGRWLAAKDAGSHTASSAALLEALDNSRHWIDRRIGYYELGELTLSADEQDHARRMLLSVLAPSTTALNQPVIKVIWVRSTIFSGIGAGAITLITYPESMFWAILPPGQLHLNFRC